MIWQYNYFKFINEYEFSQLFTDGFATKSNVFATTNEWKLWSEQSSFRAKENLIRRDSKNWSIEICKVCINRPAKKSTIIFSRELITEF